MHTHRISSSSFSQLIKTKKPAKSRGINLNFFIFYLVTILFISRPITYSIFIRKIKTSCCTIRKREIISNTSLRELSFLRVRTLFCTPLTLRITSNISINIPTKKPLFLEALFRQKHKINMQNILCLNGFNEALATVLIEIS